MEFVFQSYGCFGVSRLTILSETISEAESEPVGDCVPVVPTKVDPASNSVFPDEEQTDSKVPDNQKLGSSDEPKRQNSSADIQNQAFKNMGLSEDSISAELSINGHDMVPSHTVQGC